MSTRLAHIIAASTDAHGRIDRSKLYDQLSVSPDAPEHLLIEYVLTSVEASDAVCTSNLVTQQKVVEAIDGMEASVGKLLHQFRADLAEDAKSRRIWLSIAMAVPSLVSVLGLITIYYLLRK